MLLVRELDASRENLMLGLAEVSPSVGLGFFLVAKGFCCEGNSRRDKK
jgi:hypothetical protein